MPSSGVVRCATVMGSAMASTRRWVTGAAPASGEITG